MTNHFNALSLQLNALGPKHGLSTVFNDLLTLTLCSYHPVNIQNLIGGLQIEDFEKDPDNENLYFETIKKYDSEELNTFSKVMAHLQLQAVEHPYTDILGEFFTAEITNGRNGQFFTPEHVCTMMAQMTVPKEQEGQKILDPACGSGRLLIKAAKINPNNYFFGSDNDATCAKMAAVNFFFNGLSGEVSWMDSLSMKWFGGWHINVGTLGIMPIEREQSYIWTRPPEPKTNAPEDGSQLVLF